MENKNLQNFYVFLKENKDVHEELKKQMSNIKGAEEKVIFAKMVEFGKKHGFEFTVEDMASSKEKLSDEELGKVNGGTVILPITRTITIITSGSKVKPKA